MKENGEKKRWNKLLFAQTDFVINLLMIYYIKRYRNIIKHLKQPITNM